jgi:hypothetical protein
MPLKTDHALIVLRSPPAATNAYFYCQIQLLLPPVQDVEEGEACWSIPGTAPHVLLMNTMTKQTAVLLVLPHLLIVWLALMQTPVSIVPMAII